MTLNNLRIVNESFLSRLCERHKNFSDFNALNDANEPLNKDYGELSIDDWFNVERRIFLHPQVFPSDKGVKLFNDMIDGISIDGGFQQYIGMTDNDPHLIWYLLKLRKIMIDLGANPSDQRSLFNYIPSNLVCFGSGDGKLIKDLLKVFKPLHLLVAVRSLDDLRSSFDTLNWGEVWNQYCEDPRKKITILPYKTPGDLKLLLVKKHFVSIEHSLICCPGPSRFIYEEDRSVLFGREMTFQHDYLGFTIDEYNMTWNSVNALCKKTRIFSLPGSRSKVSGSYIVCGSGPSLDESIEVLRNLPKGWTIIACASNYRTLRAASIEVDILCLLERGEYEYDNYLSVKNEYGVGKTKLCASVTSDHRLHDLFDESMVFFRPALTPLCIFATNPAQILSFEGPQTVNTGVALCAALGAKQVVLIGVDLGTTNLGKLRSDKAVGTSDRELSIEVDGNFCEIAYSNNLLLDGALAMEECLNSNPSMTVYNASNGIRIKGTIPTPLREIPWHNFSEDELLSSQIALNDWWSQRGFFDSQLLLKQWTSSRIRPQISDTLESVRSLMKSEEPWFISVQDQLAEILDLNMPISSSVGRRLFRSILLKLAIVITRQSYVLLAQKNGPAMQSEFMIKARQLMEECCDMLEEEAYDLFDILEAKLTKLIVKA